MLELGGYPQEFPGLGVYSVFIEACISVGFQAAALNPLLVFYRFL